MEYPNIDSVMGLPRGGLIPAVMISHELGIPLVINPTKNTLVVDDINDTGHTLDKAVTESYSDNALSKSVELSIPPLSETTACLFIIKKY